MSSSSPASVHEAVLPPCPYSDYSKHFELAMKAFRLLYARTEIAFSFVSIDDPDFYPLPSSSPSPEHAYAVKEILDNLSPSAKAFLDLFIHEPADAPEAITTPSELSRKSSAILYARKIWKWRLGDCYLAMDELKATAAALAS